MLPACSQSVYSGTSLSINLQPGSQVAEDMAVDRPDHSNPLLNSCFTEEINIMHYLLTVYCLFHCWNK